MGMQQKDLRKLCARLREDRLIAVYGSLSAMLLPRKASWVPER